MLTDQTFHVERNPSRSDLSRFKPSAAKPLWGLKANC